MVLQKFKAVFRYLAFLLSIVKKSLCCFRRRRKSSVDSVPLTGIGVVPSNFHNQKNKNNDEELVNWNSWEDPSKPRAPQTVEEHIQFYRSQRMGVQNDSPTEEQPVDFFQDMEPTIKKPPKIVMRPKESVQQVDRLAFDPSKEVALPGDSGELKSWEETENREGFWADPSEWNTEEILRAKRLEEKKRKMVEGHPKHRGSVT